MTKIGIITGSTRTDRVNLQVAEYVLEVAKAHNQDAKFEIVDIKDYDLPMIDTAPPGMLNRNYPDERTQRWSEKIDSLDGFIFVTPEYNKNNTPALLNALDVISPEWGNKAAGLVGYGSTGAVTAIQTLRITLSNFNVATVGQFADFNLFTEFEEGTFKPFDYRKPTVQGLVDATVAWAKAFETLRK
ncbi:NADPH-dependent oxidoreductase [Suicoccus acidiformans]|uniref:NADPH-dependent oxidoreductase n=1 Tax=Suicoccus acidiformans TaxID=2036206 RepID=A0A347WML4_9LACT|nr:NAD(P)H-dependent oxidoreductase [Suicoccus acidiformans]AXY26321.1 NADPH-dependent oxidoreductase [Suicoccus acidiformans]